MLFRSVRPLPTRGLLGGGRGYVLYLVKEIYDLPMITLVFPAHVAVAVAFEKPIGFAINYNGKKYSVCEPTPQKLNLSVGELMPELYKSSYEIAFEYTPVKN